MPKHYRPAGKKKEGTVARYVTRSQAVKTLQVSLPLFRKLCIFHGVFPREPRKKFKGNHHTYYHTKDIAYIHHNPMLEKIREIYTYEKKIKKAKAKKNEELANLLRTRKPGYTLDRVIRDRYPTFIDALRDLDDCLTMVHLFAALPAIDRLKIEVKRIHNCRRLCHEWQAYISRTHKLRKVFVSVKGIYYQAEVEGQKITWLTPHRLQQVLTEDVDYNVMLTFLEFYETLLGFINFRMYHSINVKYPPILDSRLEALAAELYALSRYLSASATASGAETEATDSSGSDLVVQQESELRLAQLQHQLHASEPGALMNMVQDAKGDVEEDEDTKKCKKLFQNNKFFLSREVPRESLLFVIPAFGGTISWEGDGAPFAEDDEDITHQIIDRPIQGHVYLSRVYVQPQWIFDCVNAGIVLPTEAYTVGRVPPPHLSPFVNDEEEGYIPDYAKTIKEWQAAARSEILPLPGAVEDDLDDPQKLLAEGYKNRAEAHEAAQKREKMMRLEKQYHEELKAELQGTNSSVIETRPSEDLDEPTEEPNPDADQIARDNESMAMIGMTNRVKGLYKAMKIGKERDRSKVDRLKKRKKLSEEAGQAGKQQKRS